MLHPHARRPPLLAVALAAALLLATLAGCGSDKSKGAEPSDCTKVSSTSFTLVARNLAWTPDCLEIKAGTTVNFTVKLEDDGIQHNLVMTGGLKGQTKLEAGPATEHLTVAFPTAGVYGYKCVIHPNMIGQIYVV